MLRWAREQHCPWDERTSANAAYGGHLEVLKWAVGHGLVNYRSWNTDTCAYAAQGGHLEVLKWARAHDCPWDWRTQRAAMRYHHPGMLQWVIDNGCPEPPDST